LLNLVNNNNIKQLPTLLKCSNSLATRCLKTSSEWNYQQVFNDNYCIYQIYSGSNV